MAIGSIAIVSSEQPQLVLWEKSLNSADEYCAVKKMCLSGRVSDLDRVLYPIRTNTLRHFTEDFFFPLLYHHTNTIDSCVRRAFGYLACLLVDLLTLPIRAITSIPRAVYNATTEHALLTYLKKSGINEQLIATDHVSVALQADFGANSTVRTDEINKTLITLWEKGIVTVYFFHQQNAVQDPWRSRSKGS